MQDGLAFFIGVERDFLFCDVRIHNDVMRCFPLLVYDGRDRRVFPKDLSVLSFIPKLATPGTSAFQGLPQLSILRWGVVFRSQDVGATALDVLECVPDLFGEGWVHVFDMPARIRDDNVSGVLLDGVAQQRQKFFVFFELRNIHQRQRLKQRSSARVDNDLHTHQGRKGGAIRSDELHLFGGESALNTDLFFQSGDSFRAFLDMRGKEIFTQKGVFIGS
ncbi:MAG: hypothetical protein BWX67_02228 [Thermotogae bacterium ADurb.Bin062]|nr:MAG: hypothetical protein BWX67_02228 [Thermotogota bacterium ADurb.Bin062]